MPTKGKSKSKPVYACDISKSARDKAKRKEKMRSQRPDQPNYDVHMKKYQSHLKALANVQTSIDNKEPIVPKARYVQTDEYNAKGQVFEKIEKDNTTLLHRIATVYSGKGTLDMEQKYKPPVINRGLIRQNQLIELVFENLKIYRSLRKVKAHHSRLEDSKWFAKQLKHMDHMSLYPLHFKKPPCTDFQMKIMTTAKDSPKQYAYLQVEMMDLTVCNLTCELFASLCPFTVENFKKLCAPAKDNESSCTCYRNNTVDKLVGMTLEDGKMHHAYWQIASSAKAFPEFAQLMPQELSKMKHTEAGLITRPIGITTGVFYVTVGPAPYLDELCNVFGKIVGPGLNFLKHMETKNIDRTGKPITPLLITDCGVVASANDVPKPMLMKDFVNKSKSDMAPVKAKGKGAKTKNEEYDNDE